MTQTQEIITHRVLKIHAGMGGVGHAGVELGGSCRGGMGYVRVGWVMQGWDVVGHIRVGKDGNYRVLNLEMPQGIKSDITIMELQVIGSL